MVAVDAVGVGAAEAREVVGMNKIEYMAAITEMVVVADVVA